MEEIADAPDLPDARNDEVKEQPVADNAALNKSWDHAEARKEIADLIGGESGQEFDAQREILGDELTGKAVALGIWGAPGTRGDVDYDLGDAFGGYWGVQTDNSTEGFVLKVWQGSEVVHTETGPNPQDTLAVGQAHGLSLSLDGPA